MKRNQQQQSGGGRQRGRDEKRRRGDDGGECRIYVGNLAFKVDEDAMRNFFSGCGKVASVDFITDYTTGKFYGTAFVEFESSEAAKRALALDGGKLLGRPVKVQAPKPIVKQKTEPIAGCKTVFVSRLPRDVTDDAMWEEFGKVGTMTNLRWVNTPAKSPVCCGFVEFEDEATAAKAVDMFHGSRALGAHGTLRANLAPDRPFRAMPADGEASGNKSEGADDGYGGGGAEEGYDESGAPAFAAPAKPKTTIIMADKKH